MASLCLFKKKGKQKHLAIKYRVNSFVLMFEFF